MRALPIFEVIVASLIFLPNAGAVEAGEFGISFEYLDFGMVPEPPRIGLIQLRGGSETQFASWAIVQGFARLGNVVENVPLSSGLEPKKNWRTSVAELSPQQVEDYNKAATPTLKLPTNQRYGVQYEGQYLIVDDQFRFKISAVLFHRGGGTDYVEYKARPYDGNYFFERAQRAIIAALEEHASKQSK